VCKPHLPISNSSSYYPSNTHRCPKHHFSRIPLPDKGGLPKLPGASRTARTTSVRVVDSSATWRELQCFPKAHPTPSRLSTGARRACLKGLVCPLEIT
jgi:hypothetical protein